MTLPDFAIVDTHLHLWDPQRIFYPWLAQNRLLNRPFLLDDFREASQGVSVDKLVFLQCEADFAQYRQEADWITSLAEKDSRIQGIIPWAPLEKGERAIPELEALAANPLIKGVRRIIQFEPDLNFCLQPDFVRGVQALGPLGLSFDICIAHVHLPQTLELVQRCPGVSFILDHIGKPDIEQGLLDPWRAQIQELANFPHVHCKLSGVATEADHRQWTREQLKPYIDHVIACFGWDRLVFGGDWPVSTQAIGYQQWVETILWAADGASQSDLKKLFRDNAIQFYRLPV